MRPNKLLRHVTGALTGLLVLAALLAGTVSASSTTVVVIAGYELSAGTPLGIAVTLQAYAEGSADSMTGSGVLTVRGAIPGNVLPACTFSVTKGFYDGSNWQLFGTMDSSECADFWGTGGIAISANPPSGSITAYTSMSEILGSGAVVVHS